MAADTVSLSPPDIERKPGVKYGPVQGRSGLRQWSGQISEDFLVELRGERGYRVYDEMRRNEPIIASLLNAITLPIVGVSWDIHPDDHASAHDLAAALHVSRALARFRRPWKSIVSDICTMFPFGYAPLETVYKYDEGKIWWDDWAFRGQDTLFEWKFSDAGEILAFVQRPAPTFQEITITADRLLLFRTTDEKNNPEGLSLLRPIYKPYFFKKTIEEIEAMGLERSLIGLPVFEAPFGATPEEIAECQELVERIKNDDQAGLVLTALGSEEHQRFNFKLVTGQDTSARATYTDRVIQRYASEITMSCLAMFLSLTGKGGSYALSSNQRDLFQVALKAWLDKIKDVINLTAIPRLLAMNGMSGRCHVETGRVSQLDLQVIANFITSGVQNGYITVDRDLEQFLRREAELPTLADSTESASEKKPEPAAPMDNSGLNQNPGENQQGIFAPKKVGAAVDAGGDAKAPMPKAAGEDEPHIFDEDALARDLDDSAIWEGYALKTIATFAGDFWSDDEPMDFGGPGPGRYPKGSGGGDSSKSPGAGGGLSADEKEATVWLDEKRARYKAGEESLHNLNHAERTVKALKHTCPACKSGVGAACKWGPYLNPVPTKAHQPRLNKVPKE